MKEVGAAVVGDFGEGFGKVGNDCLAIEAFGFAEGEKAVLGDEIDLPEVADVVDLGVDGAGGLVGGEVEFAAAMRAHEGGAVGRLGAAVAGKQQGEQNCGKSGGVWWRNRGRSPGHGIDAWAVPAGKWERGACLALAGVGEAVCWPYMFGGLLSPEINQVAVIFYFSHVSALRQLARSIETLEDLAIAKIPLVGAQNGFPFPTHHQRGFLLRGQT